MLKEEERKRNKLTTLNHFWFAGGGGSETSMEKSWALNAKYTSLPLLSWSLWKQVFVSIEVLLNSINRISSKKSFMSGFWLWYIPAFFRNNRITYVNARNLLSWLSQLSSCHVISFCMNKVFVSLSRKKN